MTDVKIRPGTARRLGIRQPLGVLTGIITFGRNLTPEEYEEIVKRFTVARKNGCTIWLTSSTEVEVQRARPDRRRWFRRDSA
jgi:hypothetical protein